MHTSPSSATPLAGPLDAQAALLGRLVELVLSWPCPTCGRTGLCSCYASEPHAEPAMSDEPEPDGDQPELQDQQAGP